MTMKKTTDTHPLVGRGFHTQNENGRTEWQGKVIADCDGGYFLLQLFEWFTGGPSTSHVFHIADFAASHANGVPKFRFFESVEVANSYMESTAKYQDQHLDRANDDDLPAGVTAADIEYYSQQDRPDWEHPS